MCRMKASTQRSSRPSSQVNAVDVTRMVCRLIVVTSRAISSTQSLGLSQCLALNCVPSERSALFARELAECAGLHRNYVCRVEHGERNVGLENIARFAEALFVKTRDLFKPLP